MASVVLTDATVVIGAHTLTTKVLGISLNYEAAAVVETAMSQGTEVNKGGVLKWGGTITCKQDYADDDIDEDVFSLIGTTATFTGKPTSAATSAANPAYTGTALIVGYEPLNAQHGELARFSLRFVSAGALSRATA